MNRPNVQPDALERLVIERACEQLQYSYARYIDFRDYEGFTELFAVDAVLNLAGNVLEGRDAIFRYCQSRPAGLRSRHVITNSFIEVLDSQSARGMCYLTLYRRLAGPAAAGTPLPMSLPAAVGHYEDRFCRDEGGWQFVWRTAHIAFRDDTPS